LTSTVGGDLGERRLAQRFPGGLLTRKRSQVQTLSRPPSFSLVNALSAPDRPCVLVPRPRCGRSLLLYRTEWDLRSRTTPAQRPRRVISISRPSRPSHWQPVQDAPAGRRVSSCSCSCPSQPTGTLRWTAPMSARRRARRRSRRGSIQAAGLPSTLSEPGTAEPTTIPSPPAPHSGQRRPSHWPTIATYRTRRAQTWAAPPHRRMPGSSAVRTARTPGPRSPEACPSGHQDRAGRVDTGRPPDPVDRRPPGGQRTRTGDQWRVRRPDILDGHGHWRLGWPNPLGLPGRRRSAIHDGSAVTTPAAAAVTAAAPGSRTAPLGMKPRLGALLSCVGLEGTRGGQWDYGKVRVRGRVGAGVLMGAGVALVAGRCAGRRWC
jgi:hypothetical protein